MVASGDALEREASERAEDSANGVTRFRNMAREKKLKARKAAERAARKAGK